MAVSEGKSRTFIARIFTVVEDVVYVGLGVLLAASAAALLVSAIASCAQSLVGGTFGRDVVQLLDRILLVLLVVELLYTVQVSFREHVIVPEPFLLIGLIAAIRRILVLTAELGHAGAEAAKGDDAIRRFAMELGVLALLVVALAAALYVLRRKDTTSSAQRA